MSAGSWRRPARRRSATRRPDRTRSGSWTSPTIETIAGGTWRIAGCRDYWSTFEPPWHVSQTANQFDAVELALAKYERLFGHPLVDSCPIDVETGEILPVVTVVIDNGGPFRSFRFEACILRHPELRHVRTKVRSPGQDGSRERGFGCLKYEWLFLEPIDNALDLVQHAEDYRVEYITIRPHDVLAWNTPLDVHLGLADPTILTLQPAKTLPLS